VAVHGYAIQACNVKLYQHLWQKRITNTLDLFGNSIKPVVFFWHKFFNRNAIVIHFIFNNYTLTNV